MNCRKTQLNCNIYIAFRSLSIVIFFFWQRIQSHARTVKQVTIGSITQRKRNMIRKISWSPFIQFCCRTHDLNIFISASDSNACIDQVRWDEKKSKSRLLWSIIDKTVPSVIPFSSLLKRTRVRCLFGFVHDYILIEKIIPTIK